MAMFVKSDCDKAARIAKLYAGDREAEDQLTIQERDKADEPASEAPIFRLSGFRRTSVS